jgi:hypothetical protein
VATVSFLASRAAPTGGFWVALAGGVALARVAERRGLRQGYGASLAAMLESVAIMGPARFGVPFTQAITAPVLGRFEARAVAPFVQWLWCAVIRLLNNSLATAFFIVVTGFDAYSGTYERIGEKVGVEIGTAEVLGLTALGLLAWAAFASAVQVMVYRRGLRRWPDEAPDGPPPEANARNAVVHRQRYDPRAVALAAVVAFALLLSSTDWEVLAVAGAWLALAWATCRPDLQFVPTGLVLTAIIALTVFGFGLTGGLGLDTAARRGLRAMLLVLVATWLRAAAGADGLREVSRRVLGRLRRLPAMPEAARTLDQIGTEGRLLAAGRALTDRLRSVRRRPTPILDAVLDWVSHESSRFQAGAAAPVTGLRARPADALLIVLAAAPAAALLA